MKIIYLKIIFTATALVLSLGANSQSFVNGELDGTVGTSVLPPGWSSVPLSDPACAASSVTQATTDIIDGAGPNMSGGIAGMPYSGTTAVSGLRSFYTLFSWMFDEGIMQTVNGFVPGNTYRIRLYQTVVRQTEAPDPSGSWGVYKDNTLIAVTSPTTALQLPTDVNLNWELRQVSFTATSTSHTIKFMPEDDDPNIMDNEGLRMGIDSVTLLGGSLPLSIQFNEFQVEQYGQGTTLTWDLITTDNNQTIYIERSANNKDFSTIGSLENVTSGNYSFIHEEPLQTQAYYRLKTIQKDRSKVYSEVVSTNSAQTITLNSIYPNPANDVLNLSFSITDNISFNIEVTDALGRSVIAETKNTQQGASTIQLDVSSLQEGLYFINVSDHRTDIVENRKFIKK